MVGFLQQETPERGTRHARRMRYQSDGAACSGTRAYGTLLSVMSIEDAIDGALAAQLAPLRAEIRRLTAEVEAVRRALPRSSCPSQRRPRRSG